MTIQKSDDDGRRGARPRIQSVARAAGILRALALNPEGLHAMEIASQVALTRQTTYHLLHTLRSVGLVEKGFNSKFILGLEIGTLAAGFSTQLEPPRELLVRLDRLAADTGEASSVVGWRGNEIVVLAHVSGDHAVQVANVHVGQVGAAHARASGKALLTSAESRKTEAYLSAHEMTPLTPNTLTTPESLDKEFRRIRRQGYAIDNEEYCLGIVCAASVAKLGGQDFTFSVSVPAERFFDNEQRYLSAVVEAAKSASLASIG